MDVQACAPKGFEIREMPKDPQAAMILRQRQFQKLVGVWDLRVTPFPPTFVRTDRVLHNLDMAVQEASEAWDMVEGGWKHHKKNPAPTDRGELLMEVADIMAFVLNAYLFMGGEPEEEMVTSLIGRSQTIKVVPTVWGMEEAWRRACVFRKASGSQVEALYGHAGEAYGDDLAKATAHWVNWCRDKLSQVAQTIRGALSNLPSRDRAPDRFPAAPGYLYLECVQPVMTLASAIPDCTMQEFYSAFMHKVDINFERQGRAY